MGQGPQESINNCLLLCMLVGVPTTPVTLPRLAELVSAVTGWEISSWELMKISERGINLARLFNIKHGLTVEDDTLPDRYFDAPVPDGPSKGQYIDRTQFQKMLDQYYALHGWDSDGIPTQETLERLGLAESVL